MKRKNKFNAQKVYYHPKYDLTVDYNFFKGIKDFEVFDSIFECTVYKHLLKHTSYIKRQVKIPLLECNLIIDFALCYLVKINKKSDIELRKTLLLVEAKGHETALWKLKKKQFYSLYPQVDLFVVSSTTDLFRLNSLLLEKQFSEFTMENFL